MKMTFGREDLRVANDADTEFVCAGAVDLCKSRVVPTTALLMNLLRVNFIGSCLTYGPAFSVRSLCNKRLVACFSEKLFATPLRGGKPPFRTMRLLMLTAYFRH
jgi:hypothetical protein